MLSRFVAAWLVVFVAGCTPGTSINTPDCETNTDCSGGMICVSGACIELCTTNDHCPAGQICNASGTCEVATALPRIDNVLGNGPNDVIADGMVVVGVNLADATFTLAGLGGDVPITVRSQAAAQAELVFPADVRSGDYTLTATNGAGSADQTIALTLPELTGDILLNRINTDATGTVAMARLPVAALAGAGLDGSSGTVIDVVQGPGSGLDADTLDGVQASDLVRQSDPRFATGNLVTPLRITATPVDVTSPGRRILVNGIDVMTGQKDANGIYLVVLSGTTHQPVTSDTRFNANYDVNGLDGANLAIGLHLALADIAVGDFVILASQGPVDGNFIEFQNDLIGMGAVPMSRGVLGVDDLYVMVGQKGLGVTGAAEVLAHQGGGAKSVDLVLVDDRIVAAPALHRRNRIVDWLSLDSDLSISNNTSWTPSSLDGNLGPYTFYSTGKPLHIYFKAMTYTYAHSNGARIDATNEDAGLLVKVVMDNVVNDDYCDYVYVRAWNDNFDNSHGPTVCDSTLRVPPGPHTIGFVHETLGWRSVLYSGPMKSRLVIEEID